MKTLWQEFLKIIHEEVGSRVVETWFKAVLFVRWDNLEKKVYLEAPNAFVRDWITTHYRQLVERHLARLLNEKEVTVFFVQAQDFAHMQSAPRQTAASNPVIQQRFYQPAKPLSQPISRTALSAAVVSQNVKTSINQTYLFDTFVVGPSNELAFAAAHAVTEKPGMLYNPLFIYGGAGLGKTHLLHAIGNHIRERNKRAHVVYIAADRFVHEFISAIRFDKVAQFEAKYKDIDVLLVDDIQLIAHKEQTQEAFFHIFNSIHQARKQIVFTCDSMPRDISGLAARMRSRLEWGLVVQIDLPVHETKVAILHRKAEAQNEFLPDDVAYALASYDFPSVRELEGSLIRVFAYASLTKQPVTVELVHKVLEAERRTIIREQGADLQKIAALVAETYHCTLQDLRSVRRDKDISFARHIAMYCMKKFTDKSLKEIGSFLQRKDHTTVLHACSKIQEQRESDRLFNVQLERLEKKISQESYHE